MTLTFLGLAGWATLAAALDIGAPAPLIDSRGLDGQPVRLADLRGKVVIVDFWATWCGPCREEMPVLEALSTRYRDQGLVVIGVSVDRELDHVREFVTRNRITFPNVHDADHSIAGRYRPPRMPSSYVIDREGVVRHVHAGFNAAEGERIEREVQALLGR